MRRKILSLHTITIIAIVVSVTAVALAGCGTVSSGPGIVIAPQSFDFGTVDPAGGVKNTEFVVTNTGAGELEILNVSTSCGCTTASVDNKLLRPQESTKLSVEFDPSMHIGDAAGDIYHVIYVRSNDPAQEEVEAEIRAFIQ